MTIKSALLLTSSLIVFSLAADPALAASLVGTPCSAGGPGEGPSEVGTTKMDDDETGTVGCFYTEAGSGKAVWKAAFPIIPQTSQRRFMFPASAEWIVPEGVYAANISMAGGGGSGLGWRVSNALMTGHSGGYVFSHPVVLTPGEKITIIVGTGGVGYHPKKTATVAQPGPPYYVYVPPTGDDGLGGYPGTSSKVISSKSGVLLECAGGSGATAGGMDTMSSGTLIVGPQNGATFGSGNPSFPSPNRVAIGPYSTAGGPGACGANGYGIGNRGTTSWDVTSGYFNGATTPFGFGSGGGVGSAGCYVNFTTVGRCISPESGRGGVVYIDVIY